MISVTHQVEDLRAASGWLADQGFTRQLVHAHSFGTLPALQAAPKHVETMVLSAAITGPLDYDWEDVFSSAQLDELEQVGYTTIHDDSDSPREEFLIGRDSLKELSLNNPEDLFRNLEVPILLIHDSDDIQRGFLDLTKEALPLLPEGSRIETVSDASFGQGQRLDILSDLASSWAESHLPVR